MADSVVSGGVHSQVVEQNSLVQPDSHLDRLLIQTNLEEPWFKSMIRNLREAINPPKLPPLEVTSRPVEDGNFERLTNAEMPWYKSLVSNIRELINPPKLPPLQITSRPIEGDDFGQLNKVEIPWYKSLISNVRDLINPPKLPPLEVTSKPVEVGSIWGAYGGGERKSGAVSLLIHVGVIALLFLVFQSKTVREKTHQIFNPIYLPDWKPKLPPAAQKAGGGGGGGQKMPEPVAKGAAPKFAPKQFQPPV